MMMISDKMRKSNGLTFVRLPTRHTLDKQIEQTSTMMTMMKMMVKMMMKEMMMMVKMMKVIMISSGRKSRQRVKLSYSSEITFVAMRN